METTIREVHGVASDLSKAMMDLGEIWRDPARYVETQRSIIGATVSDQLARNAAYRQYCAGFGFTGLTDATDALERIPVIPSSLFKRPGLQVMSGAEREIIKWCTSSGTRGGLSLVPRDEATLTAFLGSISSVTSELFDIDRTGNHRAFILGPSPQEAGDLWISYVLSTMALDFVTEYLERDGQYSVREAVQSIRRATDEGAPVLVIGPPFRIADLAEEILAAGKPLVLRDTSFIVSAGGWKRHQNEAIARPAYTDLVMRAFGILETAVRDEFNMVELNSVLTECQAHEKHVLPWLDVNTRDPRTNEPLPEGTEGILAYCDGSARSYPCFILGEDYGVVESGPCSCGRIGKRVRIVRRLEGIEARGCALKMATGADDSESMDITTRFYKSYFRLPEPYRQAHAEALAAVGGNDDER